MGDHRAEKLADDRHANSDGAPLFALNDIALALRATQDQINAAVRAVTPGFGYAVTLLAQGLTNQLFEFLPRDVFQSAPAERCRSDLCEQSAATDTAED